MNREILRMALSAISSNKLRSLLSCLGIFIGVFSIILILTMMDGFKYYINNTFSTLGGNSVYVSKMPLIITSFEDFIKFQKRENISIRVADNIKNESAYATHVAPLFNSRKAVTYGNETGRVQINSSTESIPFVQGLEVEQGRFYTAGEVQSAANVAVIGTDVVERYFKKIDPIGETIKIDGYKFRVIGVLKSRGSFFGNSLDNEIHTPITTVRGGFKSRRRGITIGVAAASPKHIEILKDELTGIVRKARKVEPVEENDFAIFQFNEISSFIDTITQTAYLTVFAISLISLLVGGVGIMNIMVVSVTERTREIGIRKSLGARRGGILKQFLYEAMMLTVIGGLPAIFVGFGSAAFALVMIEWDFQLTLTPFLIGFGFSVVVGIVSGFLPALRASKLKPVEALAH